MVLGDQHVHVLGRQPVSALVGGDRGLLHLQESSNRLLLQPFAGIARRDARGLSELGRGEPATRSERRVEAELLPQVDSVELERVNRGLKEPLCQRFLSGRNSLAQHRAPPQMHSMGVRSAASQWKAGRQRGALRTRF